MRTEEQKQAFVMECLEIEKAGGDVLGYIEVNWPSYTPRATWYNLQRRFLHRSTAQLTEGKPKGSGTRMGKMQEVANAVMDAYARGENVYDWLEKNGYRNPSSQWYQLKLYAQKHDMELYERMCDVKQERRKTKPRTEMSAPINFPEEPVQDLKAGEPMPVKLPAGGKIEAGKPSPFPDPDYSNEMIIPQNTGDHVSAENFRKTVEFKGKEYERMNKPSPTCCQPARPSGVTVPDELPVCAVKSRIKGEWHLSSVEGCVHLIWEDRMTHEERSLGLPADDWKKLAKEIPMMLMQLGLSN